MTDGAPLPRIKQDLIELADYAYERLRGRVDGLTDEEFFWEPAPGCWSVRRTGDGTFRADRSPVPVRPAPLTTIAWRLSHLIDLLAGERNATWVGVQVSGRLERAGEPGTAAAAIEQLERAYGLFRAHVDATDADDLTVPLGPIGGPYAGSTRAAFILHELDELIHHGAEVGTMRDLYLATRPIPPFTAAVLGADQPVVDGLLAADPSLRERHAGLVAEMAARGHWPAVRLLLDAGFDVNASAGITALHYAAGAGDLAVVRMLVERGADRTARDTEFGLPPVEWARYFGRDDAAALLDGSDEVARPGPAGPGRPGGRKSG
jgi:hypothetical protein